MNKIKILPLHQYKNFLSQYFKRMVYYSSTSMLPVNVTAVVTNILSHERLHNSRIVFQNIIRGLYDK